MEQPDSEHNQKFGDSQPLKGHFGGPEPTGQDDEQETADSE